MKVQETKDGHDVKITFIPENEEEQRIMALLQKHFYWTFSEKQETYPKYEGVTIKNDCVASLSLKFKEFTR